MKRPVVSVVLPTHNRASVLGRAMRSVLAQTLRDIELIVVDDGSRDNTSDVVASFDDDRVVFIRREHCAGAAAARNIGINAARAEWIAFQDSDDEWLLDKLSQQLRAVTSAPDNTALVCCGYVVMGRTGKVIYVGADRRKQLGDWAADNIYDFSFITPTWLARKDALLTIGKFDEALPNLEDWELAFRLFRNFKMIALDAPLVVKHGSEDSINPDKLSRSISLAAILERHRDIWLKTPEVLSKLYDELGSCQCMSGDVGAGRRSLRLAARYSPSSPKIWIKWIASHFGRQAYARLARLAR